MNQYDFDLLLQKYLAGECTPEEEKQILDWSENMLQTSQVTISKSEKDQIRKRLWKRLSALTRPNSVFKSIWIRLSMAASVLIALAFGSTVLWPSSSSRTIKELAITQPFTLPQGNIEVKNTSDNPYRVVLEDGSQVTLQPQARLSYPEHFEEKSRIVHLSGEAFFDVTKNPLKPFFVHTGELVTRVLGTSFNVKSYNDAKSIEVSVVTGRVSVYENSKKTQQTRNGIILNPNQKIRFDSEVKMLVPELVEEPVVVHPPEKKALFVFEETPLPKVVSMIQDVYGIEIVLESAALENCVFTGDINELPLYSQLKLICKSINANYELRGTTLFMSGEGCRN
ncbi:FecR family protein [Dyadobacter sp. CY312]|uniref:FecR family protein n=1 Tax=Dyadobacter sp. CY312 TaxID=2907303 RepID=UPI001F16B014|nr:FecR family protein [Dyadobacter sp. CY312]MCE7044555.1 FecR domain-containing protein [Dyadobacter sp. CY312]